LAFGIWVPDTQVIGGLQSPPPLPPPIYGIHSFTTNTTLARINTIACFQNTRRQACHKFNLFLPFVFFPFYFSFFIFLFCEAFGWGWWGAYPATAVVGNRQTT
jgi:hypothetical protein